MAAFLLLDSKPSAVRTLAVKEFLSHGQYHTLYLKLSFCVYYLCSWHSKAASENKNLPDIKGETPFAQTLWFSCFQMLF